MINIIAIILFIAILISKMRRKIVRNLQKLEFVLMQIKQNSTNQLT